MQHLDEGFSWDLMMVDGYLWLPHSQWAIFDPWHGYLFLVTGTPNFDGYPVDGPLRNPVITSWKQWCLDPINFTGLKKHPKIGGVSDFATSGDAAYNPINYRYWYIKKVLWYIMIYHL
jgi:hypothetical protein